MNASSLVCIGFTEWYSFEYFFNPIFEEGSIEIDVECIRLFLICRLISNLR